MNRIKLLLLLGFMVFALTPGANAQKQAQPNQPQVTEDENYQGMKLLNAYMNEMGFTDIPGLKITGNKAVDLQNYAEAKTAFAEKNSNAFNKESNGKKGNPNAKSSLMGSDMPCAATPLAPTGTPTPYDNTTATADPGEVNPGAGTGPGATCNTQDGWCGFGTGEPGAQNSIWYTFTAPALTALQLYEITLDNTPDLQFALWAVTDCSNYLTYTEVAANDDSGAGTSPRLLLSNAQVTGGTTYYLQVDGWGGTTGAGNILTNIINIPPNDMPCNAVALNIGGTTPFNNEFATADPGEVSPGGGTIGNAPTCDAIDGWCSFETAIQNSLWYTFIAPPFGTNVPLGTVGTLDLQFAVWEVGDCSNYGSFIEIAANDDGGDFFDPFLDMNLGAIPCLFPGKTYYLQVDGFAGAFGAEDITAAYGNDPDACTSVSPVIPTMGEWGLIILALLLLSIGTVFYMRRETSLAGAGNVSVSGNRSLFNGSLYGKVLLGTFVAVTLGFAVAILAFGYQLTNADIPGALVAIPILAYLVHLVWGKPEE